MTINELKLSGMLMVCDYFRNDVKDIFETTPLLSAFATQVREVYMDLLFYRQNVPSNQVDNLRMSLRKLDDTHDTFNRAAFYLLEAAIQKSTDDKQKSDYTWLQNTLFPLGLRVNRLSLVAEVGECLRLESQLEEEDIKQTLQTIQINLGSKTQTALDWMQDIVDIGRQMSTTWRASANLDAQSSPPAKGKKGKKISDKPIDIPEPQLPLAISEREARNNFFELIRALRTTTTLALKNNPQQYQLFWKALDEQLAKPSPVSSKKNTPPADPNIPPNSP